jgi:hypothetical protein
MQQVDNEQDYIRINMSIVSHNSLKYKPYEYKGEEPVKPEPETNLGKDFIIINANSNNNETNFNINNETYFSNSLNFTRLKNFLKSYFITKREPDEIQNV